MPVLRARYGITGRRVNIETKRDKLSGPTAEGLEFKVVHWLVRVYPLIQTPCAQSSLGRGTSSAACVSQFLPSKGITVIFLIVAGSKQRTLTL